MPQEFGLLIEDFLDVGVQPIALRQHLVELMLAEHRAQRRLRQLAGRRHEVLDPDDRPLRIDDAEIEDGVHLDRNIVARNHVLGRHAVHHDAQIDLHHLLREGNEEDQAGTFHGAEAAEREDDAALIFPEDTDRRRKEDDREEHDQDTGDVIERHRASPELAVSPGRWRTARAAALGELVCTSAQTPAST